MPLISRIACLPLLAFVTGCTYSAHGLDIADDQVALLRDVESNGWGSAAFVTHVDGRSRGLGLFDVYKLAPGRHVISVRGNAQMHMDGYFVDLEFIAAPAGRYQIKQEALPQHGRWRAWIIDESSNEVVSTEGRVRWE